MRSISNFTQDLAVMLALGAPVVALGAAALEHGDAGSPRIPMLRLQRERALGVAAAPAVAAVGALPHVPSGSQPRPKWGAMQELPSNGSNTVGFDATVTSHYKDTLPDIARRYGLGYEEINRANPGIDVWLPGEGTRILLPGRHRLPSGSRNGIVVNLAEHRLYYFPKATASEKPRVTTYPVSIGKLGRGSPLGQTSIIAKVEHPFWYPPASARLDHAARGELLPASVAPGPDNPLGDYMMRLGFGDGSYEIHGTNKPVSVGMDSTYGCIGMYPEDVAALFAQVAVGTPVRLVN